MGNEDSETGLALELGKSPPGPGVEEISSLMEMSEGLMGSSGSSLVTERPSLGEWSSREREAELVEEEGVELRERSCLNFGSVLKERERERESNEVLLLKWVQIGFYMYK